MALVVPNMRKLKYTPNALVERVLPSKGDISAKVGDVVEPFTKLGMSKASFGRLKIGSRLKIAKRKAVDSFFYKDEEIGKVKNSVVVAPFNGYLRREEGVYVFEQEQRDYWLLSGVWGAVQNVYAKRSVLLKTQMVDINLAVCTRVSYAGELIVFPNPSEILEMQYLEKFSKNVAGKIIYIGSFASMEVLKRASELGVGGILAGGVDRDGYTFATERNLFLGIFSGFGQMPTPNFVYAILKEISNRYVFLEGHVNLLRVPVPPDFHTVDVSTKSPLFIDLKPDMRIQIFEQPYFGWIGRVESIQGDIVYAILDESGETVQVHYPNVIGLL
jgi:hypothetical protein